MDRQLKRAGSVGPFARRPRATRARAATLCSVKEGVRRYLYTEQLAACTPWSAEAIRTMIARGTFKLGVHYFKPHGANGRPIFSWEAIVKYIEGDRGVARTGDVIPLSDGTVIDLDEATTKAYRLRG